MSFDPAQVPVELTFRDLRRGPGVGENRLHDEQYLRERGDTAIRTNADLVQKAQFHEDPQFPDRKASRANAEKAVELDMADRMLRRFAIQQMVLQCMQEQGIDAIVYPSSNLPPAKLGAPPEPSVNGAAVRGVSSANRVSPRSPYRPDSPRWSMTACAIPARRSCSLRAAAVATVQRQHQGYAHRRADSRQTTGRRRHRRTAVLRATAVPDRGGLRGRHPSPHAAAGFRAAAPRALKYDRLRHHLCGVSRAAVRKGLLARARCAAC